MTDPHEQGRTVAQPIGGGWPEPTEEEAPTELGWPHEELGAEQASPDEDGLEAWLEQRDEATAPVVEQPEPSSSTASELHDAVEPEPSHDAEQPAVAAPTRPRRRVLVAAGLAVLLGLDAFLAVAAVRTRGIGADEEGRRDALSAARNAARLVLSYDYRRLDADIKAALATTTGDFRAEYTRTTAALKKDGVPTRYKAVVVAEVSDAAVVTGDSDRAQVLVFVNQLSTSTLTSAPKVTTSRVLMRLVHSDGRWLVDEVDAI